MFKIKATGLVVVIIHRPFATLFVCMYIWILVISFSETQYIWIDLTLIIHDIKPSTTNKNGHLITRKWSAGKLVTLTCTTHLNIIADQTRTLVTMVHVLLQNNGPHQNTNDIQEQLEEHDRVQG